MFRVVRPLKMTQFARSQYWPRYDLIPSIRRQDHGGQIPEVRKRHRQLGVSVLTRKWSFVDKQLDR